MKPAIISVTYKYRLDESEKNSEYQYLYKTCLSIYTNNMGMFRGHINEKDVFCDFSLEIQKRLHLSFNEIMRGSGIYGSGIPNLRDESGSQKFKYMKKEALIDDDCTADKLRLNILFESEPLTLIGTIADKIIVAIGDKSEDIKSKNEISVITITLSPNVWINSYKEI